MAGDSREARIRDAERRRQLEGNTLFCNLGEPIQKLLMQVQNDVSQAEMQLLSKITVRQLAKVYDMLALEEDPEKILAWLKREARKNAGEVDPDGRRRRDKVSTGANRDAISFYKELEKKNVELMEHMKMSQREREQKAQENIAVRRQRRQEAIAHAEEEKARAIASGEPATAVRAADKLKKSDLRDIMGTFDRFTAKSSTFDNSVAAPDSEWWKAEEYRRDFEKNGPNGRLWNRVVAGGSQPATEAELATRQQWYKSQCWWKSDKYRRDWAASRDAEWWKEETYIRDWQERAEKGVMWTAADELSGFNRKGDKRPASHAEHARRVEWYRNNGPKGIVKMWSALTEGAADRCTLDEKREREDYFKNGEWWKADGLRLKALESGQQASTVEAVTFAGAAGEDREWWKDEKYRRDFLKGGAAWNAASEKAAVTGQAVPCSTGEAAKREEWYAENWWKADKYADDFRKHGEAGKQWRARAEEDTASPNPKFCRDSEAAQRADWYQSAADREWWKDDIYRRDWEQNGAKGARWTGAWKEAALAGTGDRDRAEPSELAKREEYYRQNWWKAEKFVKDFQANGAKGTAWKSAKADAHTDAEWWKQGDYQRKFAAAKAHDLTPFWQQPEAIADFMAHGAAGKKWTAANAAAASVGKGDEMRASPEELAEREAFLRKNWWRSPEAVADFAANGAAGKVWTAAAPGSSERASADELAARRAHMMPAWHGAVNNGFNAMLESDAVAPVSGAFASPQELKEREERLRKDWWKSPEVRADWEAHGAKGKLLRAATEEAAALGLADDPAYAASPEEVARRVAWLEKEAPMDTDFWQQPEAIADFLAHGASGKKWKAANADAAAAGRGDVSPASAAELKEREAWLQKNFWKAPQYKADFKAHGSDGKLWTNAKPDGSGAPVADDERLRRRQWFEGATPFWQQPECVADFLAHGASGKKWKAANADAAAAGRGDVSPASAAELKEREAWLQKNFWKTPECQRDFEKNGASGKLWTSSQADGKGAPVCAAEQDLRKQWFEAAVPWYEQPAIAADYNATREAQFWKSPEAIADYLAHGAAGKKWKAAHAAAAAANRGDVESAPAEDLKDREEWLKNNFWKAPQYKEDFEKNGAKGTLWTTTQPGGKGHTASPGELEAREEYFRPKHAWQLASQPSTEEAKEGACSPVELLERESWMKRNWWKSPEVREDYEKHGKHSRLLKAATPEVVALGLADDPRYQASADEVAERAQYFDTVQDSEWWQDPAVVDDYMKNGEAGATWQARNFKEGQMSMGAEHPATCAELEERKQWFEKNFWKAPSAIEDFQKNGNKGAAWTRKGAVGDEAKERAADAEIERRRQWMEEHQLVNDGEVTRRRAWFQRQLSDDEKAMRRQWFEKAGEESKKIHKDELVDVLTALNDGEKPSEEQLKAIEDAVRRRRVEMFGAASNPNSEAISQEEFVVAVADTNFYVPTTDEERQRQEDEALEAMRLAEMQRLEEEAAFLAMEAQEERDKAGADYVDETAAEDEEAKYLAAMENEEQLAARANEDDKQYSAEEEEAWNDFLDQKGDEAAVDASPEEQARLQEEEEERLAAEAAQAESDAAVWESEEFGGEEGAEEAPDAPATISEDTKDELQALVEEDPAEGWEGDEEALVDEPIDELLSEEKGVPLQWKLPLPEVTNPQFLKSYFTVIKFTPSHSLFGGKQKRVWVVDHFTRCFYNLEKSGKIKKEHQANKLLQLERNVSDPNRLRLMFFDSAHSYELQFFSPQERERFYESAMAIRPSIRVYAPDLTNPDGSVEACTTTIDGVGPNAVTVTCNNASGKPVTRELTGECKVNASKLLTEPLTIWVGTFNLAGHMPPRNSNDLASWMPKDKYDIYAIGVQEASYRKTESEWFSYVQDYFGREYLTLASMCLWDTLLIVMARKKHLLKITNVEGSTKATVHKSVCGTKGGIGISLRFLETSMCFVTCHLAARLERTAMRNTNVEEIVDGLQLAIRETDFVNQFNHVFMFGDFNYRVEMETGPAEGLIESKGYAELLETDQLTVQRRDDGILYGFQEPPVTFAPTYRMQAGSAKYMAEKGNAPSYCDRVLTRSMANTWVKCTSYKSAPAVTFSEHQPVAATFIVRCVRPCMSLFMKAQSPIPLFVFDKIEFTESVGPIIKKPVLQVFSPFTGAVKPIDARAQQTNSPMWQGTIPKLESVTHAQEYLETCHIVFVVREAAEKREDKSHRGTAVLTLFGRVLGVQDMQQEFDAEILCHGRCVGKMTGAFHWEPAPLA
mgnify:FL=1